MPRCSAKALITNNEAVKTSQTPIMACIRQKEPGSASASYISPRQIIHRSDAPACGLTSALEENLDGCPLADAVARKSDVMARRHPVKATRLPGQYCREKRQRHGSLP